MSIRAATSRGGSRADEGFYFGPFASRRAADAFAEGFLDLFKIRRCQIKIRRDPSFPGCIYSEMKMCLAPCFAGCTKQEYDAEVGRVLETLDTTGAALTAKFEREREAASEALDFERAAALHKRLEKVSAALRGLPELARRIEDLDAVILQRAAEEKTVIVFPLRAGILGEPCFLNFAELSSQPRSVEAILRERLEPQINTDKHRSNRGTEPETSTEAAADREARRQTGASDTACARRRRNWPNTCRSWRAGFIPSRAKAKFSFAKTTGPTVASSALAEDCSHLPLRRPAKRRSRAPEVMPAAIAGSAARDCIVQLN